MFPMDGCEGKLFINIHIINIHLFYKEMTLCVNILNILIYLHVHQISVLIFHNFTEKDFYCLAIPRSYPTQLPQF